MNDSPFSTAGICGLAVVLFGLGSVSSAPAAELDPKNPLNPPGAVYLCPNRTPDRQYSANPEPGCIPLVGKEEKSLKEKEKARGTAKPAQERAPIKIQDIQNESTKFLDQYRQFLDCCASDPGTLPELVDLEDQAVHLLRSMQQAGFVNMGTSQRGFTANQIVRSVAQVRDDLRKLQKRWQALDQAYEKIEALDYEAAGREQRQIREEESTIQKEFQPTTPPQSAPTGTDIGKPGTTQGPPATTLSNRVGTANDNTTLRNAFGADIGEVVSPASDQRTDLRPRMGRNLDISEPTTLPTREGTATGDTTLSNTIGFEIGTQQGPTGSTSLPTSAGPAIGNSNLNRR